MISAIADFIDSNFLARETSELARVNLELKRAVAQNQNNLNYLNSEIQRYTELLNAAHGEHRNLTAELERLNQARGQLEGERNRAKAELSLTAGRLKELESEATTAAAKADKSKADCKATEATLSRLKADLERAEKKNQTALAKLKTDLDGAKAEHAAELESLEAQRIERIEAINLEIEALENDLADITARRDEIRRQIIAEAQEQIEIARGIFENERRAAELALENDRLQVHKELTMSQEQVIEKFKPLIEAPLLEEIQGLQIELGKLTKQLTAKAGKSFEWNPEQIEALLIRTLDDGTKRPNHLRIAGESESGKSHFVNQLISQGLQHFGLDCDFELFDPYPSDTKWAIAPTISDDSKAVLSRLNHWREFCESEQSEKLPRPLILVCDEADEMIRQFKGEMVDCIKALWKRGRHVNVILWLLGQNGNVAPLKPLDWSDLKNAGGVYLNQVGFDYIKNSLKGRTVNTLTGELEAIAEKHQYYALVHCKGKPKPYAVAVPKQLFPTTTTAPAQPATESTTTTAPALACPKCGSTNIKKAGQLNGRQRVKCNDCKKQSYAE